MKRFQSGFTLAELLIALAILGVIATFTIPKVLNAGANGQNTAIFKEAASTVSGAFSAYQLNNTVTSGTHIDLTQFMNYVAVDAATDLDAGGGAASFACAAGAPCLNLHNGAVLQFDNDDSFGANTTYIVFNVDPDGSNTAVGASGIVLYNNGRMTDCPNKTGTIGNSTLGVAGAWCTTNPSYVDW